MPLRAGIGISIFSLSKQKEIATIVAHKYGVNDVTFSPDGKLFATAARDYTVKLWSTETLEAIAVLDRQRNLVQSVQFSPDGQTLLTGSDSTRLWEVSDFTQLDSWNVTSGWTWAIDFSPSADIFLTAQINGQVKLWRASDRKEIQSLAGHESDVSEAKFSPNGQFIASDIIDTKTGKIYYEAGTEIDEEFLQFVVEQKITKLDILKTDNIEIGSHIRGTLQLDKARSREEALDILKRLNNSMHYLISSVCTVSYTHLTLPTKA